MPRRINPRLGWRYPRGIRQGVADDELREAYSEAFIEGISDKFKIPPEARPALRQTALSAGAYYKQRKMIVDDRPRPVEVRAFFEGIEYHASSLLDLLEQADDISCGRYRKFEQEILEECAFLKSSTAMQDIGALRLIDPENDTWEMYTTDDLPPLLKLAMLITHRAEREAPTPKRGTKGLIALRRWVRSLCDLWEGKLGQVVTIDPANPGSSETFRFLEALLEPLDPKAVGYLPTVLREERSRRRHNN